MFLSPYLVRVVSEESLVQQCNGVKQTLTYVCDSLVPGVVLLEDGEVGGHFSKSLRLCHRGRLWVPSLSPFSLPPGFE